MTGQLHQSESTPVSNQVYDGFISYSHAADGLLAPRLQAGLQRFAKPWWKRRAVRIFRDESSLSANPHLWSSITEALETSGWFVLLLSPDAASSVWVNEEIAYWKTHRDPSRILPVVTDGEFGWADGDVTGDAVPEQLQGVFVAEPRWVDLRWARDEEQLDLSNPSFSAAVADVASAIRGVPKDELESEEVRQYRRTVRTAWSAGGLVLALAVVAVWAGILSARNADEAERQTEIALANAVEADRQSEIAEANATAEAAARAEADAARLEAEQAARVARSGELASSAAAVLDQDPELAILLGLESLRTSDADPAGFLIDTIWRAAQTNHVETVLRPGDGRFAVIDLSVDGSRLVAIDDGGSIAMYEVPEGRLLWSRSLATADTPIFSALHPDGTRIVVSIADSESRAFGRAVEPDDLPNRLLVLDAEDGETLEVIPYAPCTAAMALGWSPEGSVLAISSGLDPCERDGTSGSWLELVDGSNFNSLVVHDVPSSGVEIVDFTQTGEAFVFSDAAVFVIEGPSYQRLRALDVAGKGGASPDGSSIVTFSPGRPNGLARFDPQTGATLDSLTTDAFPSPIAPVEFSPDGSLVAVATEGRDLSVFDVSTGAEVLALPGGPSGSPKFSPDDRRLYSGHWDGTVRIWNLAPRTLGETVVERLRPTDHVNLGFGLGPSLGGAVLVDFATFEPRVAFFDRSNGQFMGEVANSNDTPQPLADGRFALRRDGWQVVVHDVESSTDVVIAGCRSSDFETCDETGDRADLLVAFTSLDQTELMVWNLETGEWWIASPDDGSVIEAGGFRLVGRDPVWFTSEWILTSSGGAALVVDRQTGDRLASIPTPSSGFAVASANRSILVGAFGGSIDVLDVATLEARHFTADFGRSRGVGLSPSGRLLAIGDENQILIVDLETESVVRSIPVAGASGFDWLDEETLLLGTSFPARWITVSLTEENLAADAARGLTRGFSEQECVTYRIDPCPSLEEMRGG